MKNFGVYLFASLVAGVLTSTPTCFGQLASNLPSVTLNATLPESITLSTNVSSVNFALIPGGSANGSVPVGITTSWVLAQGRANVVVDAYFLSSTGALTGGSPVVNIPSSTVYGLMSTGTPTSYTAFTQSAALGTAGGGLTLFTQALSSSNRNANRTDNLLLQINLSGMPQLPAGTYTGSLILAAQAL